MCYTAHLKFNFFNQLEAVQLLSHGAASADTPAQEIHQKTVAKYGMELRSELFGLGTKLQNIFLNFKKNCLNIAFYNKILIKSIKHSVIVIG